MDRVTHLQQVINRILRAYRRTSAKAESERASLREEYNKIQKGTSSLSRSDRNRCLDGYLRLKALLKQADIEKQKGVEINKLFEPKKT